jgi:hypothetical protein
MELFKGVLYSRDEDVWTFYLILEGVDSRSLL